MIQEIRVVNLQGDPVGHGCLHDVRHTLGFTSVTGVKTVKVFRLEGVSKDQATELAEKLLAEAITQSYWVGPVQPMNGARVMEVAYKPGVMNPEAASILKAASDLGITDLVAADTSREFHFFGTPTDEELAVIRDRLLVNKTVQRVIDQVPTTLIIQGKPGSSAVISLRTMSDDELLGLSKDKLFLNLEEMHIVQQHFCSIDRDPTDVELETIAQTWSEHCGHKTFNAKLMVDGKEKEPLITRLKKASRELHEAKGVISAFHDNAGVIRFYDGFGVSGKVETHNSPSAIEPYGGAATGSGGVFRDIMGTGQGMKNILSTDMFCFAPPDLPASELPPGCLHPNYLFRRVVAGVRDYGNRMGIPTANGSVHFHKDFRAKPTIIVGAYGIAPEEFCQKGEPQPGDLIFAVGGRTGRDGIHGATFSSGEMTATTITINSQAVQIGNAVEEKRTADALLAARDEHLIVAITDCGAGGFSSAIGEMGAKTGVWVALHRAPLKYPGLAPYEIQISESQERMIAAVRPENSERFRQICKLYNVEATILGEFTSTQRFLAEYEGEVVCDLSMEFLHHGLPQRTMIATKPPYRFMHAPLPRPGVGRAWVQVYQEVLSHGRICSKEPIVRQYDHGVQGTNALPPYGGVGQDAPNDAVILTPILGKSYGLVVSHGMNPVLMRRAPYNGALWAVAEAMANLVAVGGDPDTAVIVNNYIWPFPDEQSLWTLDSAVEGVVMAMRMYGVPVISGKDSLSSTYRFPDGTKLEIPPVLCISAFGKIPDVTKTVSSDFKREGSAIILVGKIYENAMGGSVFEELYDRSQHQRMSPMVDQNRELKYIWQVLHRHIVRGDILACHDVSEGGVAVTLAEMCFGGRIGATFDIGRLGSERPDLLFFTEMAGCFLVEVSEKVLREKKLFKDIPHTIVGHTLREFAINLSDYGGKLVSIDLEILRQAWQQPMKEVFGS
ncbi:MAG: phosphoribosylformylglycinamidine synthase [Candidatus Doudnabacteria bacterium]|nr:phosphoribosylformylglycinamidine synthase [Candidatus Doudnabacteria bacterium]